MKRQESHKSITYRDIEVVKKYRGLVAISIVLKVYAWIIILCGIIVGTMGVATRSGSDWINNLFGTTYSASPAEKIVFFVAAVLLALIASMPLFACSYILRILVDIENNARRQLKLSWLQNKYCQGEFEEEEDAKSEFEEKDDW